jgi:hypothetical protein
VCRNVDAAAVVPGARLVLSRMAQVVLAMLASSGADLVCVCVSYRYDCPRCPPANECMVAWRLGCMVLTGDCKREVMQGGRPYSWLV